MLKHVWSLLALVLMLALFAGSGRRSPVGQLSEEKQLLEAASPESSAKPAASGASLAAIQPRGMESVK